MTMIHTHCQGIVAIVHIVVTAAIAHIDQDRAIILIHPTIHQRLPQLQEVQHLQVVLLHTYPHLHILLGHVL